MTSGMLSTERSVSMTIDRTIEEPCEATSLTHGFGAERRGRPLRLGSKQEVEMGMKNNQSFVFIPHARFIDMLSYKAALVGIQVVLIEESYTSKCSFLDRESIGHQAHYRGKRIKRGLFRSASGRLINADVNGSFNILVKAFPQAFPQDLSQVRIHPVLLALPDRCQDRRKQSRTLRATG